MKALIDPRSAVQHVTDWAGNPIKPVCSDYPNSARVCEVSSSVFEVAQPLFWKECANTVGATTHYYNNTTDSFAPIINAERP